jgi:hypothetical protein
METNGDYVDVATSGLKVVSLWDMIPKYANVLAVFQGLLSRLEKLGLTSAVKEGVDTPESILRDVLPEVEKQCEGLELKFTQARLVRLIPF